MTSQLTAAQAEATLMLLPARLLLRGAVTPPPRALGGSPHGRPAPRGDGEGAGLFMARGKRPQLKAREAQPEMGGAGLALLR